MKNFYEKFLNVFKKIYEKFLKNIKKISMKNYIQKDFYKNFL